MAARVGFDWDKAVGVGAVGFVTRAAVVAQIQRGGVALLHSLDFQGMPVVRYPDAPESLRQVHAQQQVADIATPAATAIAAEVGRVVQPVGLGVQKPFDDVQPFEVRGEFGGKERWSGRLQPARRTEDELQTFFSGVVPERQSTI
ncbi:MAG: hypothetical protein F4Y02_06540 [Chloroflexi bacterium]|nr:hypothetical protein [Chloroflexota bacterium]